MKYFVILSFVATLCLMYKVIQKENAIYYIITVDTKK